MAPAATDASVSVGVEPPKVRASSLIRYPTLRGPTVTAPRLPPTIEPPPTATVTRSGIRKFVLMPPISTPALDSRGKPLTRTPTSEDVPPTSTTIASVRPVRKAPPRSEFAGPLPIVRTGKRSAKCRAMRVPSFCAKNVTGASP